jgi:hypothetical protein
MTDLFANDPDRTTRRETPDQACDICSMPILAGERWSDDGSEIAHTACMRDWFRRNFGRESLA